MTNYNNQKQYANKENKLISVNALPEIAKLKIGELHDKLADEKTTSEDLLRIHNGRRTKISNTEYIILKAVQEKEEFSDEYVVWDNAIRNYQRALRNRRVVYGALLVDKNEAENCGWNMADINAAVEDMYPDRTQELIDKKVTRIREANAAKKAKEAGKAQAQAQPAAAQATAKAANPVAL